ncbi:hypothetical protein QCA50_011085 [Cerrena zonata]|uniref:Uncharacterized protein n=1 Tax=Cerrena zonata TaxID=2478898 RepID=A0AAW0G239_9APHY
MWIFPNPNLQRSEGGGRAEIGKPPSRGSLTGVVATIYLTNHDVLMVGISYFQSNTTGLSLIRLQAYFILLLEFQLIHNLHGTLYECEGVRCTSYMALTRLCIILERVGTEKERKLPCLVLS